MLGSVEFAESAGENPPMRRFVQEINYQCFLGNVLSVSLVEWGRVIYGHEDSLDLRDASISNSRSSEDRLKPSRTDVLREIVPDEVPLTASSETNISAIEQEEGICAIYA